MEARVAVSSDPAGLDLRQGTTDKPEKPDRHGKAILNDQFDCFLHSRIVIQ